MLDYVVIYLCAVMSIAMLHVMNVIYEYNDGYNC
jgi:hypothetical protein